MERQQLETALEDQAYEVIPLHGENKRLTQEHEDTRRDASSGGTTRCRVAMLEASLK
jgi:hypothetical protein